MANHLTLLPLNLVFPKAQFAVLLLFHIYINDLENGIKSTVKFFADDTTIFAVIHNPILSATELNHDLDLISKWAYQWKMSFNSEANKQAVEMLFSQNINKIIHPPIFFNGAEVNKVHEHENLELTFDPRLPFSRHITENIKLAKKTLGALKFLSSYFPLKSLILIYKLFISSHLDIFVSCITYHFQSTFDSSNFLHLLIN